MLLQHLHRTILWSVRKIQHKKEVRLWVRIHEETRRVDHQKPKTQRKMKTTKNNEVNSRKMCRNGCRISKRIWWIRVFNHINTLPALLMNYQWSREQKWYRAQVSTVSILTSGKTKIVTYAWGQKLQGLLAEDVLVQSCSKRKNWWFNNCGSQSSQWRMWITT